VRKIRVLVVDDSVAIRRMLTDILSAEPSIAVVGASADGASALAAIPRLEPDLLILDVDIPDIGGVGVLAELRRLHPLVPVILLSPLTERAAATTLRALSLGAADCVTRPVLTLEMDAAMEQVAAQLLPRIMGLCRAEPPAPAASADQVRLATPRPVVAPVGILAVSASTGGPSALTALFAALPADLPVPVVIVQHMPPVYTRLLAARLSVSCALSFHEAGEADQLQPGHAWIAPGDRHMRLVRAGDVVRTAIDQGPPENSCRPSVDVLFRSVAATYGAASLAVVLTGVGRDGLRGCEALHRCAAQIVVQDRASAAVWGMPGAVASAGLAHAVLPLDQIAGEILRRIAEHRDG
jgi:two-component system, chemotaxis family, protein-glutamate methylesterase/glutaminase